MAIVISYEVLSKRRGKWLVESVTSDKGEAIDRANEALGSGHYQGVKVLGEKFDEDSGQTSSFVVINKEDRRKGEAPKRSGPDRRKPKSQKTGSDQRVRERRKKKKSGGFVNLLVKICLFLWAAISTVAFLICYTASQ